MENNPYKDRIGRWITQGLFLETCLADKSNICYTLKPYDHVYKGKDLPSLKKIYLSLEDPTEYRIATEYLGGWDHWQRMCGNKQLLKYIEEWRAELEVKLRSKAIQEIISDSTSPSKSAVSSAKWLADRGWAEKRKAGAPSKQEQAGIEKKIEQSIKDYDEDYIRIQKPLEFK
jgi:hypothetical protein